MARSDFFQFKKFTIRQDQCSMKVCTDACVLGAWAAIDGLRILDIGTGTGLLSLMSAQRNNLAEIDAIELDKAAFAQAVANVEASVFSGRVRVIQGAVQAYKADSLYDRIVVNPPFFQSDLRSPDEGINRAHHAQDLSFDELLSAIQRLLASQGRWSVLLPLDESKELYNKAQKAGWMPIRTLTLIHKIGKRPFRVISTYAKVEEGMTGKEEVLYIYQEDGRTYDPKFRELLKDFYLHF